MTMTKKDYELIAQGIEHELYGWRESAGPVWGTEAIKAIEALARELGGRFKAANPKFDNIKFLKACGVELLAD